MSEHSRLTIGVDLGDRWSHFCIVDGAGEVMDRGRVRTSRAAFKEHFGDLPQARIALEVGTHSPYLSRQLVADGHEVLVANPRRLKAFMRVVEREEEAKRTKSVRKKKR